MTIQWGPYETAPSGGGTSGMRVGIEVTNTAVSSASGSVTFTFRIYTQNYLAYLGDTQGLTFGGSMGSGSVAFSNASGTGAIVLRATRTYTYNYGSSSYGVSPGTGTFSATSYGAFDGTTADKTVTVQIPARPFAAPTAPTSVVATRNSDAQVTVTWVRTATSLRPYTSLTIQRRTYVGGNWGAWVNIATASSTATSMVNTGLVPNRVYQYQVRANNSVGSSAYVASAYVYMTPAAPSSVIALINPSGTTITVKWTNNAYLTSVNSITIERSVNGGAFASVVSGLAYTTTSWTDATPGAGTNAYRVKTICSVGTLNSAYATSNTVTTIVPPLAPTALSPSGVNIDLAQPLVLAWQHNPGADGADQSHFTVETSSDGGTTWVAQANDVASTASTYTIPGGILVNGTSYLWRVRTEGIVSGGYGPNSASSTFTGSATPTVAITTPSATVASLPLTASWAYAQAQGSAQAMWWATLYAADGSTVIEARSGVGATTTVAFAARVEDTVSYIVTVQVQSAAGLMSALVLRATTITLPTPAIATVDPTFQPCTGTVVIHVEGTTPLAGEAEVYSVAIERLVQGDDKWVTLVTDLAVPNDFIDPLPITNGINTYRVTAASSAPSYRVMDPVDVAGSDGQQDYGAGCDGLWVFLAYGPGFSQVLRAHSDLKISESGSRTRSAQPFLGRKKPGALIGTNTERKVDVKATLHYGDFNPSMDECLYDSPPQDWTEMGREAELVCYRDYTGRRFFGLLASVDANEVRWRILGDVSLSVIETEYDETYGLAATLAQPTIDGGVPSSAGDGHVDGGLP